VNDGAISALLLVSLVVAIVGLTAAAAQPSATAVRLAAVGLIAVPLTVTMVLLVAWSLS
jgi:hypothetical protein